MGHKGGTSVAFRPAAIRKAPPRSRVLRLALVLLAGIAPVAAAPAGAQVTEDFAGLVQTDPNAPLLLEADEIIYDNDRRIISAVGNVRIDYAGSRLFAQSVSYIEASGRLVAVGQVEILYADGTRFFAEELDITDDFRDGFVNALRVVTTDNTRFAAESAERRDGAVTIFNNGLYTACEPCAERPDKPPIWQVKAQRIIWDGNERTVRFENASFEFFGVPLARVPVFLTADPTVRRKTGFLAPRFNYADELGFSVAAPYFINLAPNADVTLTATGYTRQGLLGEAEFRHRLENGQYSLKIAGIHQASPSAFDAGTIDANERNRAMVGTTGRFAINPRWAFGWNGLLQTDKNFARTYSISGFSGGVVRNEMYLTGLANRSFFDARVLDFVVQETAVSGRNERQPTVLPSFDYNTVLPQPVAGGQLAFNLNARGIVRENVDARGSAGPTDDNFATFGVDGESWRMTAEGEWQRSFVAQGGLTLTPLLHARGDTTILDADAGGALSQTMESAGASLATDGTTFSGMATAGIEVRWPVVVSAPGSAHIFEPIGQVFVRPDAPSGGVLPNEDAQSLVFDTTTLFERDKFSGYDRIEGGVRANVGVRYAGFFGGGISADAVFGQSFHLAGDNPYDDPDLTNTGADSGLETDRSDYVGSIDLRHESGFAVGLDGRFDEADFAVRRASAGVSFSNERLQIAADYALVTAQPTYGFDTDRQEVSASGALRIGDYWQVSAGATYDLTDNAFDQQSIGLAYDDECFTFAFTYAQNRDNADAIDRTFGLQLTARTLGDVGSRVTKSNM